MTTHPTITIPVASDILGETLTIAAPAEWHARIRAIAATGATVYGERYSRSATETLREMHHRASIGYTALAYDSLVAAERFAGIAA